MQASMRRQVLWDPLGSDRFIVGGGSDVKLYQWNSKAGEVRTLASQSDLPLMRCLAWSPHSTIDDLVAVGLSTGNVELFRLNSNISSSPESQNGLDAPKFVTLPTKYQRPCYAVEFSTIDPNYLAVGLEKARNEPSLLIWDIERLARNLPSPHSSLPAFQRAVPRLPATKKALPLTGSGDVRPLQHYGSTEIIHSIAFLPGTPHLLIAGIGSKRIGVYDLRSPETNTSPNATSSGSNQPGSYITKAVYGIVTDPLDDNRFASYGDDTAIRLWDRRWPDPVLTWTEVDAGTGADPRTCHVSMIQFSKSRRGVLGSLLKDSSVVRLWDILDHRREVAEQSSEGAEASSNRWNSYQFARSHSRATSTASTLASHPHGALAMPDGPVLARTTTTGGSKKYISSFAFAPPQPVSPHIPRLITAARDGALDISAVLTSDVQSWSSRGMIVATSRARLDLDPSTKAEHIDLNDETFEIHTSWKEDGEWIVPEPWEVQEDVLAPIPSDALGLGPIITTTNERERLGRTPARIEVPSVRKTAASRSSSAAPERRAYSPAAMRRIPLGKHRRIRSASPLPLDPESATDSADAVGGDGVGASPALSEAQWRASVAPKAKIPKKGSKAEVGMREDISMVMRRRTMKGYGLKNFARNADIVAETQPSMVNLIDAWRWLDVSRDILTVGASSRINGIEFSYQGVLGIWDGFAPFSAPSAPTPTPHTHISDSPAYSPLLSVASPQVGISRPPSQRGGKRGDRHKSPQRDGYDAAVGVLNMRRDSVADSGGENGASFPGSGSDMRDGGQKRRFGRLGRRRLALALCGWDISTAELRSEIARWLREGKYTKAACWATFLNDFQLATESLMHNEMHRIMSGIVVAAEAEPDKRLKGSWREHCQKMGSRLEDPYLRIMLAHLAFDDWITVVEEAAIPLRDRLNIALRFLDDGQLNQFFQSLKKDLERSGDLDAILFTGLTTSGIRLLQRYVDTTGDVQTAAILTSLVCPGMLQDERSDKWTTTYQDLLDGWRMFHQRCQFDIERGEILRDLVVTGDREPFEWVPRQLAMRCNFCDKIVNAIGPTDFGRGASIGTSTAYDRVRLSFCPHCRKALPRCDICLMTLSGPLSDYLRDSELAHADSARDTFDEALVFCQTCRHGGHAVHIMEWFFGNGEGDVVGHRECAVADCTCNCAQEFGHEEGIEM